MKTAKLIKALLAGAKLTAKQIAARFAIKNVSAHIHDCRRKGLKVVSEKGKYFAKKK